jgi:hypothetical protein
MNEDNVEQWKHTRYVAWAALVAQRGSKEIGMPRDLLPLPGDEEVEKKEVKREDYAGLFEHLNSTWTPPSSHE